jgi:tight adherence protein C
VITAVVLGALLGGTLFAVLLTLAPPKTSPLVQLAHFDARQATVGTPAGAAMSAAATGRGGGARAALARVQGRSGFWLSRQLVRRGIGYTTLRQDLALTGRTLEDALGRKITLAGAGLLLGLLAAVVLNVAGVDLPSGTPVVFAAVLAVGFFFVPDLDARTEAARRREEFHLDLSDYLDLVALEMDGSAAPAEALPTAARVGAGWPMALIRDTLYRATRGGRNPWIALSELGSRIGVSELRDLGQLIALVAHDGAQVRSTLTARAQSMRRHQLANLEGKAGKADQSMRVAQILIGMGFIAFLGYPAVVAVLSF